MKFKKLDLQKLELKFVGEGMTFSGYASVFGEVDLGKDVIETVRGLGYRVAGDA